MIRHGLQTTLLLLGLAFHAPTYADLKRVSVTGRAVVTDETTLGQAKLSALNQARALAVEKAAGMSVSTVTLLQDSLLVGQLVETMAHGFLVEESQVTWSGIWQPARTGELGFPVVEVTLEGAVNVLPRAFFRSYALDASLPKQTYLHGESARLDITAREDIRVLVANYTSRGKIVPVYPHMKNQDNLVPKGKTLSLPRAGTDTWELELQNYAGHERDTEAFIVLGFPADGRTRSISWHELFEPGRELEYAAFFDRVLKLPIDWLAQKTLVYTVVRQ